MKSKLITAASILLALLMIVFGLNKFLGFIPVEPPSDPTARQFMGTMFSSYLYVLVAIFEILGGLLLIPNRTRFAGWLILSPVIANIVAFHIAHDFIGNGIWLLPTLLFTITGIGFAHHISNTLNPATYE